MSDLSLTAKAYNILKHEIVTCALEPGRPVSQDELARAYGLGTTPIREALQRLAREGFAVAVPRFGYIVSPITLTDVRELYELRQPLELTAVRLAAVRASDERLQQIQEASRFTYVYQDRTSYMRFLESNTEFHRSIALASDNHRLTEAVTHVLTELARIFHVGLDLRDSANEMRDDHVALATALARRDTAEASRLVEEEIARSQRRVVEALSRQSGESVDALGLAARLRQRSTSR